jgi:hypothetical protein
MQQRRKSVFAMKQAALGAGVAARKNGAPLSLAALVFALFAFATFLYNEDIKSITDFQFGAAAIRAKAPDLHLLQEAQAAAHAAVDTLARRGEEVIVQVMDATSNSTSTGPGGEKKKIITNNGNDSAAAVDVEQEKDRDVTLPTVTAGAGADEARRREAEEAEEKAALRTVVSVPETCDLYRGSWVYDEVNAPVYREGECEFLTEQVTCMRNGRRDGSYQKWRWQPTDCDLPRYVLVYCTRFSSSYGFWVIPRGVRGETLRLARAHIWWRSPSVSQTSPASLEAGAGFHRFSCARHFYSILLLIGFFSRKINLEEYGGN